MDKEEAPPATRGDVTGTRALGAHDQKYRGYMVHNHRREKTTKQRDNAANTRRHVKRKRNAANARKRIEKHRGRKQLGPRSHGRGPNPDQGKWNHQYCRGPRGDNPSLTQSQPQPGPRLEEPPGAHQ